MKKHVIVVTSYNSEKTIISTLESIRKANYLNSEIVLVDNCSHDKTVDLVKDKFSDITLVIQEKNIYVHSLVNYLTSIKGKYKYVSLYHSDDLYDKGIIQSSIESLDKNDVIAVFTQKKEIDSNDKAITNNLRKFVYKQNLLINENELLTKLIYDDGIIATPSVTLDFDKTMKIGGFNTEMGPIIDTDLWLRMNKKHKIFIINKPLLSYRIHQNQDSNKSYSDKVHPRIDFLKKYIEKTNASNSSMLNELLDEEESYECYRHGHKFNLRKAIKFSKRKFKINASYFFRVILMIIRKMKHV